MPLLLLSRQVAKLCLAIQQPPRYPTQHFVNWQTCSILDLLEAMEVLLQIPDKGLNLSEQSIVSKRGVISSTAAKGAGYL